MNRKKVYLSILLVVAVLFVGCGDINVVELTTEVPKLIQSDEDPIKENIVTDDIKEENENYEDIELYRVVGVVDGDTIIINYKGVDERVRLIGIDTPESVHPDASRNVAHGDVASNYTKKLLEGKSVGLEFDVQERDPYGRILAYVYIDNIMVNKLLLEEGVANVATYPPNVRYVDDFTKLERAARENKVGFWASEPTKDTSEQTNNDSVARLVGSVNSNKYHTEGYTHKGQIKDHNLIYFDDVEDARSKGYEPCGICY